MNKEMKTADSLQAQEALILVRSLQKYFVEKLNALSSAFGNSSPYEKVTWLRDEGRHGGGERFVAKDESLFNRASVNISQVHYDDDDTKKLGSATALSTIIHPLNPYLPSIHMHISWTQMKEGRGYWRMMADLNPSIEDKEGTSQFLQKLKTLAPKLFDEAKAQGDKYFFIPALERHRGVAHFYLENYNSGDEKADKKLAQSLGEGVVDTYISLLSEGLGASKTITDEARAQQLAYHTLYLFQVLTLDRGTTSGLLIHDQNDIGIMGSLPKFIDRALLSSWAKKVKTPQEILVKALVAVLPETEPALIDDAVKQRLADALREFYRNHPQALTLQASGDTIPDTVNNHRLKV